MGYLSSLSLSFFICKLEQIIANMYMLFYCACVMSTDVHQPPVSKEDWSPPPGSALTTYPHCEANSCAPGNLNSWRKSVSSRPSELLGHWCEQHPQPAEIQCGCALQAATQGCRRQEAVSVLRLHFTSDSRILIYVSFVIIMEIL